MTQVFDVLWRTTWQLVPFVVLIWLVQRVLRGRLAPAWRMRLWWLVVLRLLLPALPDSPAAPIAWDDLSLAGRSAADEFPAAPQDAGASPWHPPARAADPRNVLPALPMEDEERQAEAAQAALAAEVPPRTPVVSMRLSRARATPSSELEAGREPSRGAPWKQTAVLLWAAVAAALALRALAAELRFRAALRGSEPVEDPGALALLADCAARMRVRRPVALRETALVDVPATTGVWRPQLLLPPGATRRFETAELSHLFLHELAHVRHLDVAANVLLVLLRTVFWFHPAAQFALGRLVQEREAARDWEALGHASNGASPRAYARTLLRLVEERLAWTAAPTAASFLPRNHELQRRILMITQYRASRPREIVFGGGLLLGLASIGLVSASGAEVPGPDDAGEQEAGPSVPVQRLGEAPVWMQELSEGLSLEVPSVVQDGVTLRTALAQLQADTGLNFVYDEDLESELDEPLEFPRGALTEAGARAPVQEQLEQLLDEIDTDYTFVPDRGVVRLGYLDSEFPYLESRAYDLSALAAQFAGPDEAFHLWDQLTVLIHGFTGQKGLAWEVLAGASIRVWDDLLLVTQTPAVQAEVEDLLNRLLRQDGLRRTPAPIGPGLESILEQRVNLALEEATLAEVGDLLYERFGLSCSVHPDYEDQDVNLALQDVRLRHALDWIAAAASTRLTLDGDHVAFGDLGRLEVAVFDASSVLGEGLPEDELDWAKETLVQVLKEQVDPRSWEDFSGPRLESWGSTLVVRQTTANLYGVGRLLDDLGAFRSR